MTEENKEPEQIEEGEVQEELDVKEFEPEELEKESGSKAIKFLKFAQQVTLSHHERWDGSGYPHKKAADKIHLYARIVAVADVFDALTSKRPYKDPWDFYEAFNYIITQRGTHFDPQVIDAFEVLQDEILEIHTTYQD